MSITPNRVLALCEQNAVVLKEDINQLESGALKVELHGADITKQQASRLRSNLSRLLEITEGCGSDCS